MGRSAESTPKPVTCLNWYVMLLWNKVEFMTIRINWTKFADEGHASREREPLPGLLSRLRRVRHRDGVLLQRKLGGPAAERRREAGLDVQVLSAAGSHQGRYKVDGDALGKLLRAYWPGTWIHPVCCPPPQGMKYLHHRGVSHARLKSGNCVVDGRFVLKITDFSYNEVLESQRFPYIEPPAEGEGTDQGHIHLVQVETCVRFHNRTKVIRFCVFQSCCGRLQRSWGAGSRGSTGLWPVTCSALPSSCRRWWSEDLPSACWTSPLQVCCSSATMVNTTTGCDHTIPQLMCLCVSDIIEKLCKPPPLCRPVVSSDYAPIECIQLMKQCWNEQPEKRPSFEEIFDQVGWL